MNQQAMTSSDSTGSTDYVEIINSAFNSPVEYMKINDIFREYRNRTLDKINIYGVITYIHKPNRVNSPPQKKDMCTTITLVDHSCTRDQKIKTVIFFNPEDKNKIRDSCAVGDIVRLHRIKIQEYPTGQPQGLHMAKFSSWVCFKRAASDQEANTSAEFEHVGNKGNHTIYSEQDHIIVRNLRKWLRTNPQLTALNEANLSIDPKLSLTQDSNPNTNTIVNDPKSVNLQSTISHDTVQNHTELFSNLNSMSATIQSTCMRKMIRLSQIKQDGYYDVVCQVCGIGESKGAKFLLVWDTTKTSHTFLGENEFTLDQHQLFYSPEIHDLLLQVYLFDEFLMQINQSLIKPGDFILLKNMRVQKPPSSLNSSVDFILKMPGAQSTLGKKYGRSILKLDLPMDTNDDTDTEKEMDILVREIWQKGKELNIKLVKEDEFIKEKKQLGHNDTLIEIEKTNKKTSVLAQVISRLEDNEEMYTETQVVSNTSDTENCDKQTIGLVNPTIESPRRSQRLVESPKKTPPNSPRISEEKRKSPRTVPQRSEEKTPQKSPEKTPQKIPEKTPHTSPEKTPQKSPEKNPHTSQIESSQTSKKITPHTSPEKTPQKIPEKTPHTSPEKTPQKSPQKTPQKSPQKTPQKSPEKTSQTSSEKTPQKIPEKIPQKSPEKTPQKSPKKNYHTSQIESSQMSKKTTPQTSPEKNPHTSQIESSQTSPEKDKQMSSEQSPQTSPENSSQTIPETTEKSSRRSLEKSSQMIPVKSSLRRQDNSPRRSLKRKNININDVCEDIYQWNKLTKLTYFVPYLTDNDPKKLVKAVPFYSSLANLAEEASKNLKLSCKVMAKLFNYSLSPSPVIASVFVNCKCCGYINFVPFHTANIYQPAALRKIMTYLPIETSDSPDLMDLDEQFLKRAQNFSLEWLKTAYPMSQDKITQTQQQNTYDHSQIDEDINEYIDDDTDDDLDEGIDKDNGNKIYSYACPRCELKKKVWKLKYIYRFWFTLRDANSQLSPCLLEAKYAKSVLNSIRPIRFFTDPQKAKEVYSIINNKFNNKYLFSIETMQPVNEEFNDSRKLNILYKIVDMLEIK